jgi:trans-2-enoyl-CoA reductase
MLTELWAVVAGNQFGPGSGAALSDLNAQAAALLGQTGRQAGPSNNLTIASALWTQGSAVDPAFAGNMASLFKVCACHWPEAA